VGSVAEVMLQESKVLALPAGAKEFALGARNWFRFQGRNQFRTPTSGDGNLIALIGDVTLFLPDASYHYLYNNTKFP